MDIPFFKKAVALELKDKAGKRVVWYKKSYDNHVNMKHIDTKGHQDKIKKAVRSPQLKWEDKKRQATHYFYEVRKDRNGKTLYMEVIVDYNGDPAFIRSSHLTTNVGSATVVLT